MKKNDFEFEMAISNSKKIEFETPEVRGNLDRMCGPPVQTLPCRESRLSKKQPLSMRHYSKRHLPDIEQ